MPASPDTVPVQRKPPAKRRKPLDWLSGRTGKLLTEVGATAARRRWSAIGTTTVASKIERMGSDRAIVVRCLVGSDRPRNEEFVAPQ